MLAFERDAEEDWPTAKRFGFVQTFDTHIGNNEAFIPNYGERYCQGETLD